MTSQERPYLLSVVATSRNDNHGKNLLYRMQIFVDGFIEQCKKHQLPAELVLVEWNPPEHTLPLAQALRFPVDKGPCTVRIIKVPKEVHLQLQHSDKIPLFQMIGKNVGIRRARGKFVLATNIDILFSDKIFQYIKKEISEKYLYRVDRLDVPEKLPETSFDQILQFCQKNYFRANDKFGTHVIRSKPIKFKIKNIARKFFKLLAIPFKSIFYTLINLSIHKLFNGCVRLFKSLSSCSLKSFFRERIPEVIKRSTFYKIISPILKKCYCYFFPSNSHFIHTNACGDFTLLSYDKWEQLRGYPEWNIFSWHLDSILLYQAQQHGIQELDLRASFAIYHIDHETGSGYSPEGASLLFKRLEEKEIPYLKDSDLNHHRLKMKASSEKVLYNNEDWGMSKLELEEVRL